MFQADKQMKLDYSTKTVEQLITHPIINELTSQEVLTVTDVLVLTSQLKSKIRALQWNICE